MRTILFERDKGTRAFHRRVKAGAEAALRQLEVFEQELAEWKFSPVRLDQATGEAYYRGDQDIQQYRRMVIGRDGKLEEAKNLPNNRTMDNQYGKMVDQKANYLVGKPLTFDTENDQYAELLKQLLGKRFQRQLKSLCVNSLNGGIGWLYVYYNDQNELDFLRLPAYEILPFWKDDEHTELDAALRLYEVEVYDGPVKTKAEKVEVYTQSGIQRYTLEGNKLILDVENPGGPYASAKGKTYNWNRIPLLAFKYNDKEIPLIKRVKSLQDGINIILSIFGNHMQEDARSTILVIKGYGGTDPEEFRQNLSQYSIIKIEPGASETGECGVDTLYIEVNAENYKTILELLKKALIENARGFDAKDDRLSGTPNQMNIQSMYSDIDLDANGMEMEYQAAFEDLLWFLNQHLKNTGQGDFTGVPVDIIFNRDMLMNEGEIIQNCRNSVGMLSQETIVSQHPWTKDTEKELERIRKEEKERMETEYAHAFQQAGGAADEE